MPRVPKGIPNQTGKSRAKAAAVIEASHDLINDALEDITQSLIDMALGLRFQDEKGNVYTKEPNVEALKRCLEIVMGKPVARVEQGEAGEFQDFEDFMKAQQGTATAFLLPTTEHPPTLALQAGSKDRIEAAKDRMEDVLADIGWMDE